MLKNRKGSNILKGKPRIEKGKKKIAERDIAKQLKKELDLLPNIFYERFEPTPFYGAGRPDFFLIKKGRFIAIETKSLEVGPKLRKSQIEYKKNLDRVEVPYFIIFDSNSINELLEYLRGI
ncbi:MAG: VRR-NUC domain-containing protein [Caudoviricetes sp.]|nr:MAG: VRR-NUC domain-containing protein [Caudoviricetes sp.]